MIDIVDTSTRSRIMASIKGRDTKPEILIRKLLHKRGFRFRLHVKELPGKPDVVLKKYKAVIFINGCFWHGHKDCHLFKLPATRTDFWEEKINKNQLNDTKTIKLLLDNDWRVCVVWECSVRGAKKDLNMVINSISNWLLSDSVFTEIY
ncbi:TPA: very short patch repair endonuclease [Acinetobacter baumannii]|uniref:very short patch repair endonuclease n=1 Tax=Acinetobacter baumannii TaxID=470 RepID=UPI00081034DD|nr:DNA mismatch endonuclease Vsr [Acinetobacter baumannii]MBK4747604.1 Very short patch repair protein [Acinetobacter baumannii]MDC5119699.1 DNA mismatch endonuclease Vsr [Acinetobacter baumannii]OOD18932.1 very short patch repair endonuclease [Acinetobacter baumannii]RDJ47111.1 DNA glycosylase [Acinetobacter baumannii]TKV57196.1 DNA mismatch endonuclease Vsr [Acinetobacter baumannii]